MQRSNGGFFVQQDEDELFELLTCTGVGDVTLPAGDSTAVYCPSLSKVGHFDIDDIIEGEAGLVSYTLTKPLRATLNELLVELRNCFFHGRVNWRTKGSVPDLFTNYLVGIHLFRSRVSSSTLGQPVVLAADENERVETNADIEAFDYYMIHPKEATRITQTEISAINGVTFDLSAACYEGEVGGDLEGKDGYISTDHTSTSPAVSADIWYSTDYGATWTLCAATPFAAAEDAGPIATYGGRVIVGRITADAGNAAEIAYSDDYGATWTNVDLGATNSQTVDDITWLDWTHCWAACSGGYVYFSADGGESWTAQTSGGITAQNLVGIDAYDRSNVVATGAAGAIIQTTDGTNWQAVTGPAAVADQFNCVLMRNANRWFIGSDAGNMYKTTDGGTAWTALTNPQWSGGEVVKIKADPERRYFMYVIGETSGTVGELYTSEDGGASFYEITDFPTNSGVNDMFVIDQNTGFVGGEPHGGTAFLEKFHAAS
jgi:photosystem II stability/assembly factor-like uncharacterized protein